MVSAIGLGAMSFAGVYGGAEDEESAATVGRALELGVNFVDTANIYGSGHSEEVVGRAIAGRRADVVLHQGNDIVPIPGTRKRENLEANAAAADVILSADDLREIDAVASPDSVAGARGADAYMARVNA
jgi:aryl-alcohol dehydrogenase-like predicted oxidoreductase